jgi:pimeloyl-ACP methyl ester carboxylesterase
MKGCLELVLQHPERVERLVLVDTMGFSPLAT